MTDKTPEAVAVGAIRNDWWPLEVMRLKGNKEVKSAQKLLEILADYRKAISAEHIEKVEACPLECLRDTIVSDSLDYGSHWRLAWIYGIAVGWDDESLLEFEKDFTDWDREASNRLRELRLSWIKIEKKLKGES